MNILRNDRIVGAIGLLLLLALCLPYIILGEDAYIIIHDNLDGVISNLKLLKDNHALFDPDAILPMMGGIRRSSFGNEWNLTLLPFAVLPCYWANVVNILIVKITAYVGMFLLLRKYLTKELHLVIVMLVSLAFACIPYYATCCGISAAGIPLLVYAFLNLRDSRHLAISYILVVYYALGSYLPFSGMFICAYLFAYGVYLYCKERTPNKHYIYALVVLCGIYLLTNNNILLSLFVDSGYVSHRTEWGITQMTSFREMAETWWNWVLNSQCHAGYFAAKCCVVMYLISIIFQRSRKMWIIGGIWLSVIVLVFAMKCLPYVFHNIAVFQEYQLDRFYFLYPAICYAMAAIAMENIYVRFQSYTKIVGGCMALVGIWLVANTVIKDDEIRKNWKHLMKPPYVQQPTYRQFYAEDIFDAICEDLNIEDRKSVKVASIGMFPAIAEYNGFYCIDGYMSDYPLSYKQAFRPIIARELEKDKGLGEYFDLWGNRCYVFTAESNREYYRNKNSEFEFHSLDLDFSELTSLGCQYLLSSMPLPTNPKMKYAGEYMTEKSFWNIHVYQLLAE